MLIVLYPLYEAFSPEEASCFVKKLVFHHTPKHGSWLNMAEIELSNYGHSLREPISNFILICYTEISKAGYYPLQPA